MARSDPQVNIRMPQALKDSLEAATEVTNRSLNGEIVERLESSFEPQGDPAMASVVVRLNTDLADVEQQLASANLHLGELALTLRLAVYHIPKEVRSADPELEAQINQWIEESQELLDEPDRLVREAKEKTQKFLDVTKRLGDFAAELKDLNDAKEQRLPEEAEPPPSSNLHLSLGKPRRTKGT